MKRIISSRICEFVLRVIPYAILVAAIGWVLYRLYSLYGLAIFADIPVEFSFFCMLLGVLIYMIFWDVMEFFWCRNASSDDPSNVPLEDNVA